jgi:hypothetical protein
LRPYSTTRPKAERQAYFDKFEEHFLDLHYKQLICDRCNVRTFGAAQYNVVFEVSTKLLRRLTKQVARLMVVLDRFSREGMIRLSSSE